MAERTTLLKIGTLLAVGGIQFFDFVSDVAVVAQWYLEGHSAVATAGVVCLAASTVVAAFVGFFHLLNELSLQKYSLLQRIIIVFFITCTNLHVLS